MAMPSPQPQPAAAGLDVGAAFSYGWSKFQAYAGPLVIITLVVFAGQVVLTLITTAVDNFVIRALLQIVTFVVTQVLVRGLVRAALMVVNGQAPDAGKVFDLNDLGPYLVGAVLYGIMVVIGFALCIIPGIILGALFGFWPFVVVERGVDGVSGLQRSFELTKSRLPSVLLFGVAFFALNLVGALLCGVGRS